MPTAHIDETRLRSFLERGFIELDFDASLLAPHIPVIQDGMRRLSRDSDAQSLLAEKTIRTDEAGWKQEAGYVKRIDREYKEYFHHQSLPVAWPDTPTTRRYADFFASCGAMTRMAKDLVMAFVAELESAEFVPESDDGPISTAVARSNAVTRILRYPPLPEERGNHAEAYAHFDRSFMTVHWWASHEGLAIFDKAGTAHRVAELHWNRVALFPGKKFFGLTQGRFGRLGIHGVRDARGTGRSDDRFALVTFVHAALSEDEARMIHDKKSEFDHAEAACVL